MYKLLYGQKKKESQLSYQLLGNLKYQNVTNAMSLLEI